MADDPATEAIVRECLHQLDTASAAAATSYEDALYRLQALLMGQMIQSVEAPSPDAQQAVAQALARLHPSADDHLIDHGERLRRLLTQVDGQLFKWTSGMVQSQGPSGAAVMAERPPAPVER